MRLLGLIVAVIAAARAVAAPIDDAQALLRAGKPAAAEEILTRLAVEDPKNAEVAYVMGLVMNAEKKYGHGLSWLERAVALDPANEHYLADYGGSSLEEADRENSYTLATRGRDAMIQAIGMNPKDVDARDGLMQFYAKAPWPLGDKAEAKRQAEAIAALNPVRGLVAAAFLAITEKRYGEAITLCRRAIAQEPNDYSALYNLGRAASFSGTELDLGIASLRKCLTLTPTSEDAGPSAVQYRLGTLFEKKGDYPAARAAYRAAIQLDPHNKPAVQALDKIHG
jgi:tetratricopeptide (TPR) repeat protein